MTAKHWPRIKEVFCSALERDPGLRPAFLESACESDAALRTEVESLLAAYEAEPGFIEGPALRTDDVGELGGADPLVDKMLGPYRVVRRIAYGGMGAVYTAVRADDAYRKQVAIKLIRWDRYFDQPWRQEELLRRFRTERQTLANLDHPHIARLFDGGTTDDGLPYLVMEYIEGRPIDEYCDRHELSTTARVKLFRAVCGAVHYAHQHLVVHRDLKPSNILVTADGTPKLLDFGIAKLLHPESTPGSHETRTSNQPMTPVYASPEQIRGDRITTAADVYSLGVILYELLTGHRPYRLSNVPRHEVARAICEQQPDKPSTAVMLVEEQPTCDGSRWITLTPQSVSLPREGRPDRLRRRLAGDLDMIVLKALRKELDRRYASVEQFSEDIRRHLEGLPVVARPDTFAYRASKFVRRHALGVGITAVTLLLLTAASTVTAWSARRAQGERDAALQARTEAEAVTRFLGEMLASGDPHAGQARDVTVRELLDKAAKQIETSFADQPAVQARLHNTIGMTYRALAQYPPAEFHLRAALEIHRRVFGDEHPEVARSLTYLGFLLRTVGELAEAESLYREALATRRNLLGNEHPDVADSLAYLSELLYFKGDYVAAESLCREWGAIYRKLYGEEHLDVANNLNSLGNLLLQKGDYEGAQTLLHEALAMRRRLLGDEHLLVSQSLHNLAKVLRTLGDDDGAEAMLREALAIRRKVVGDQHPDFAYVLNSLGQLLHSRGDYAGAEPLFRQALEIFQKVYHDEHPLVAKTLANLELLLTDVQRAASDGPE